MKGLAEEKISRWKTEYVRMIRKAMLNTKGDRFISKSPSNMARISKILEIFPDARFIFIYRDPYKTVESFYRFFQEILNIRFLLQHFRSGAVEVAAGHYHYGDI